MSLKLAVSTTTADNEAVYVVGNIPEMGVWKHDQAVALKKDDKTGEKWTAEVTISAPGTVLYRYFVATSVADTEGQRKVLVRKWEVGLQPRSVDVESGKPVSRDDGEFGIVSGKSKIDQGWLCGQTEIRFNISDAGDLPIVSWRKPNTNPHLQILLEAEDGIPVDMKLIKPFAFESPNPDKPVDLPKKDDSVLTFALETMDVGHFSGRFVVSDGDGNVIGYAGVMGRMLSGSIGFLNLALLSSTGKGIGSLHVEYVVIKTYTNENLSMKGSYATYWKHRPTLHIGHRGAGNSFTAETMSDLYENTISSFKKAALHSAAMIEFDVQLTKDKVPVIFHDFTICASVASKSSQPSLHEVEVQSLTYDDIQTYAVHHRSRKTDTREPKFSEHDDHPHFQPFPKFEDVFKEVPENTGFDIELKWPHYYVTKEWEHGVSRYFDANEFLDRILDVVFEFGGKRRIIFSCFEANVCTMLRRKQNRYPVFYLTNGDSRHYIEFMELRSRYNRLAIGFAMSEKFLGLATLENDAYADQELVKKVHDAGLLLFLYGNDISETANKEKLIEQQVDGIIYDRIHDALPEGQNIYLELPSS